MLNRARLRECFEASLRLTQFHYCQSFEFLALRPFSFLATAPLVPLQEPSLPPIPSLKSSLFRGDGLMTVLLSNSTLMGVTRSTSRSTFINSLNRRVTADSRAVKLA